ncbi:hypothetical protein V6R21_05045 [Limibacter armeniacum]|uniref:hypothetical protein n=1 Tax=Limibacter armeniacum TaxID=466084 RepID=UPI002FE6014F
MEEKTSFEAPKSQPLDKNNDDILTAVKMFFRQRRQHEMPQEEFDQLKKVLLEEQKKHSKK